MELEEEAGVESNVCFGGVSSVFVLERERREREREKNGSYVSSAM